jgi:hypothetical protein
LGQVVIGGNSAVIRDEVTGQVFVKPSLNAIDKPQLAHSLKFTLFQDGSDWWQKKVGFAVWA